MLAALVSIPPDVGYAAVFALIAVETMGIPVPGETALIAAALLAHSGRMDIGTLVAFAAAAAILGDNVGFMLGRRIGRRVFGRPGPFLSHRLRILEVGEPFFARHGPKAVFLGRWVSGLRIASAWLAGMNRMRWPVFLAWNALGGVLWAASIGFAVYFAGHLAERAISVAGPVAAGLVVSLTVLWLLRRRRQRRSLDARGTSTGADGR